MQQQPESSKPRRFGPVGYLVASIVVAGICSSLLLDGGLARVALDLGGGIGPGLVPVVLGGALTSIAFLILGLSTPSGDQVPARPHSAIGLEDLPPLIDVRRTTAGARRD
jgi:hypothetical protein